jgi:hypothetical protein
MKWQRTASAMDSPTATQGTQARSPASAWVQPLTGREALTKAERRRRNRESKQRSRAGTAMSRTEALELGRRLRLLRRPYVSKLARGNGGQPRGPGGRFRVGVGADAVTRTEPKY